MSSHSWRSNILHTPVVCIPGPFWRIVIDIEIFSACIILQVNFGFDGIHWNPQFSKCRNVKEESWHWIHLIGEITYSATNFTADATFTDIWNVLARGKYEGFYPNMESTRLSSETTLNYIIDLYFSQINQLRGGIPKRPTRQRKHVF